MFRVEFIGPFGLFTPTGARVEIRSRKAIALLALLASSPSGARTRIWLQMMLWGSRETAQAQSSLRRELANLVQTLELQGADHLLVRENRRIQLRLDMLEVDILRIGVDVNRAAWRDQGDFLEGIDLPGCEQFEDWLRLQRGRFADLVALPTPAPSAPISAAEVLGAPVAGTLDLVGESPPPRPPKPSVVVVPFVSFTTCDRDRWIGESLAEEIGVTLAQFPQLFVVASSAGAALSARRLTVTEIAMELGVRYVLGGWTRDGGAGTKVTAQLLDGTTGEQIWTRAFVIEDGAAMGVEEQIALAVAPQIWTQIDLAERHRGIVCPIRERSTYALYWRANALFREWRRESTLEAVRLTDELVDLDPTCPLAAALAGFCNGIAYRFGWTADASATRRKAIVHFQNTLRLGGDNVEAIGYAVGTLVSIDGDIAVAEQLVNHALTLLPSYQPTLFWGGWVSLAKGDADLARERFELSLRINPASGVRGYALTGIGLAHLMEGRPEAAYPVLRAATTRLPENPLAQAALAIAGAACGDHEVARSAAERVDALGGADAAFAILRSDAQRSLMVRGLAMARAK